MTAEPRSSSLYARAARAVRARPSLGIAILVGSVMHAAGHALLAAAGGALARVLAGAADLGNARSIPLLGGDATFASDLQGVAFALGIAGVVAASAKLVGGVVAAWAEARLAGEVGQSLRLEIVDRLLGAHGSVNSVRAPRQDDHGAALARKIAALTTHVTDIERGIASGVLGEMRAVVQLAPLAVLLAILAPKLAGSAALALGGFAVLVMITRRALKRRHALAAREADLLLGTADETVRHADLWRTYGAERRVRDHLAALGKRIVDTSARLRARGALLSATSELLGALALVLVLGLVSAGALGGVERGAIVPFAIAFFMAYKPLREIVEARLARARAEDALSHVTMDFDGGTPLDAAGPSAGVDWPLAELSTEGLVAEHGAHAPLTMRVAPGSIVVIVGPTGVGKTSLLRVLLGLDRPRAGALRFGDRDLTGRGVGPSERPFAWVPQEAPVIGDTLVANVMLGASSGDRARASALLATLGADELASSVGDAVLSADRPVSGGERQWIAMARALATNLPVLLLDEPTSALDPDAQALVLHAIERLRGKRTVVLVTHRPEPLAIADVVVRLEEPREAGEARPRAVERAGAVVRDRALRAQG
ncbi:MAG: ABC transporter ATP-binding protein [Deltaproteobacteria bacterium]|nr:ABC transporter ATP-binding protein [Deltaproteobacteria bacterium]